MLPISELPIVALALLASLLAGLATGVGALGVYAVRAIGERLRDRLLGFAAGVMLAASVFSLILPALEAAGGTDEAAGLRPVLVVIAALLLGAGAVLAMNTWLPHEHFVAGRRGPGAERVGRVWLFVFAIAIHNLPEGMAVGTGFGAGVENGLALAIGIGAQNVPEGFAVAVALRAVGYARHPAFGVALLTGLVEPLGGLLGALAVTASAVLLPWGLAFAAGAMIFVISDEIIPETHRATAKAHPTVALMLGFAAMMFLDVTLG